MPDFGLSFKETVIPRNTWEMYGEALLRAEENWGIVELGYQFPEDRKPGKIKLISFKDFCPYLEFGSVKGMEMDKYLELKEKFEANRDDENAVKMAAYMRNLFSFYGLSTPKRKAIYKDFLKSEKRKKIIDWDLLNRCYADEHREFHYFVMDYLVAMQKFLKFDDVSHIEKYIKTNQWWDTIDGLDRIVGNIAFTDERINDLMLEWSTDEDFWVRRIAIDHQLCRKERTNTELLEKILVNNFGSSEFFINKAIGWSLRDYSKTNPDWVRNFVETHKDKMDKLSIREASKYL